MSEATARLRKTFHYKADSDDGDDSLPEALDEEEQASLIQTLHTSNTQNNKLYARALLSLPILSATLYLRPLLFPSSSRRTTTATSTTYHSILSLTSLALSAYALWILPDSLPTTITTTNTPTQRGRHASEEFEYEEPADQTYPHWSTRSSSNINNNNNNNYSNNSNSNNSSHQEKRPLETYLPYLNTALATLLALAGLLTQGKTQQGGGEAGEELWLALLPGFVYGIVLVARWIMGSVDVGELEGLRYGYKGA